jgi:prepilin-type N-terminal cleavage/methylation domain-containing protein
MSGRYEGFTLVEVLVALMLIAVPFMVLLEILSTAKERYERGRDEFGRFIFLDRKLKERNLEGLEVHRRKLPDFPAIEEVIYSHEGIFFVRYERK